MPGARDGQLHIRRGGDSPPWAMQLFDDELGLWLTLAQADELEEAMRAGIPVLRGPYVVDYTDIPHDGDKMTLWTPAVGDVLLRLFVDWKTRVQWDHGALSIGPNVDGVGNVNIIAGAIAGQIASYIRTYGVLDSVLDAGFGQNDDDTGNGFYSSAWVFHTTDPVQIQLTGTGGTDPTTGHVELYAFVARAVAS